MSLSQLPIMHAVHPSQYQQFTTEELRSNFLLTALKDNDQPNLVYTHYDRLIAGTIIPVKGEVNLPNYDNLKSNFFLERRELGIINVGEAGKVTVDGQSFDLNKYDCLYVGMGSKEVAFAGS